MLKPNRTCQAPNKPNTYKYIYMYAYAYIYTKLGAFTPHAVEDKLHLGSWHSTNSSMPKEIGAKLAAAQSAIASLFKHACSSPAVDNRTKTMLL